MTGIRACVCLCVLALTGGTATDAFVASPRVRALGEAAMFTGGLGVRSTLTVVPRRRGVAALGAPLGMTVDGLGAHAAAPPASCPLRVRGGSVAAGKGEDKGSRGRLSRAWGWYLGALESRPVLTKSLSSGAISGTANLIEQRLSATAFSLVDWTAFTLVGAVFIGSALHYWYNFLERVANSRAVTSRVSSKWGRVSVQVALDMTVGASLVNSGYFAVHTAVLAALTGTLFPLPELGSSIVDKVASRYVVMIVNNAKLWPWVGCVNFAFVPTDLRVLVSNVVAVFWGVLMSRWCKRF